jgi:hypothetical protein
MNFAAPLVLFTLDWGSQPSPELSSSVICAIRGSTHSGPLGCDVVTLQGQWSYGVLVNYTGSIMLGPQNNWEIGLTFTCTCSSI